MIDTAEIVAKRYGISREAQDEYALQSQQRTAAAQAAGRSTTRSSPMTTTKAVVDKDTKRGHATKKSRCQQDEGNRADTTLEGLPSSSRCAATGTASPPATPASSPTARRPAC